MITMLAGYQAYEAIYESDNSLVYRARREMDDQLVILKMLKQAYPSPEKIAWFKREYELTRNMNLAGVVDVYSLETDQHRPIMVLEDFGGKSLELFMQARPFTLAEFLPLAMQIADILGHVHRQHIMHKDINPSNIILNPTTAQLKLIDFGSATVLTRENPVLRNLRVLEGTLAYISPEQTGRMNRAMDYRTDFYSLGVTFYELLTGQVPFPTTDAVALVHAHIAKHPPLPHELNPDIPQLLSAIVMKLMAKNAEDRYQSAYGLRADLEECLRQWQATGHIDRFLLGQYDVVDRFHLPQKLYGRDTEIAKLLAAFERVSQGASDMMLVSGFAGIGKSALVQEVYKPITQRRGYFVSGKFDQFHRNVPYASLTQALRALMRQLLAESEAQIATWREQVFVALGPNGQVVIDVIPEVELMLGPQPAVPALPPTEAQNRLHTVFQNFLRVFTKPEHPLVLFLDDLQWADTASLHLLQRVVTAPDSQYLFVIGAYRDNEVHAAHPLLMTLDAIQQVGRMVHHIVLGPLDLPHVNQLIADTLNCAPEQTRPLAELVWAKTHGNPFFMNEFLKSLYTEGLLTLNVQRGVWQWDVAYIEERDMTDNVVELLVGKVQRLGEQTQQVLKLAACIGNQFDLHTLAIVYENASRETAASLWEAMVEGLVVPLGDAYVLMDLDVQGLAEEVTVDYKFAHDRIQQAAYSLIPEEEKQAVHWQVGQLLLQNTPATEREQKIFVIVNHLNLGLTCISCQEERDELAAFNLMAGKKAKVASAYVSAFNYSQVGLGLLGAESWHWQYDLTLALYVEAAEAAYLSGDLEQMERLIAVVLQQANTLLGKVKVYEIHLHAYTAQNKPREGLRAGLHVLKLLGMHLPEQPSQADIIRGLEETQRVLAGRRIGELIDLPEMTDPYKLAKIRILSTMSHFAYVGFPKIFPFVVFSMVNLSAKYGNTPLSARAYATYGLVLCDIAGDIEAGYQFGELALDLVERFSARELKARTVFMVNQFTKHWKEHIGATLESFLEGYQIGLETGDLNGAAFDAYGYGCQSYWVGKELTRLEREMAQYSNAINQINQRHALNLNELYRQAVLNLLGRTENPCRLIGESYDEEKMLPLRLKANDRNTICQIYLHKFILCYLFQEYHQAVEHAAKAEEHLDGLIGAAAVPAFYLYDSLAKLAVLPETRKSEHQCLLDKIAANQKKMKKWAQHAPMNYLHKFYLVEAERARVLGNDRDARDYYDQAIDLAHEHEYVNEEALANELAAKFYLARGHVRIAHHYLRDTHYAYMRWGALAKVKDLETRYPQFLARTATDPFPTSLSTSISRTGQRESSALDLTSVLKASQALSSEIVLDKLLDKLMNIVIENAGAQRGCLILEQDGQLVIEAEQAADTDDVVVLQSIPVDTCPDLPVTLIHYVERTKEDVVLSDAAQEGIFTTDPYVAKTQPKSILCTPLLNQGKLTRILYLENNLTTGAFTSDRLAVLNLLSSQEAISIENASLYRKLQEANAQLEDYSKTLKQKVEDRTRELQEKNRELGIANQQLLEVTERKTQFFNSMSHELRTPLDAIIGFSEVLQEQAFGALTTKQEEYVNYILTSGTHLLSLINDMLDLAKIDAGMIELQRDDFHLKSLLEGSLVMIQGRALEHNILLSLDIADDIDAIVGDERRVKQIVLNLLSNAVKFTPDQGNIGIKATKAAEKVQITVWDTGIGIAPEDQQRIFEEFQQVGYGRTTKTEGTGLGLTLTKRLVELHGDTIRVESSPGQGSTFTFSLPIAAATPPLPAV